jgi:hypothetical protein
MVVHHCIGLAEPAALIPQLGVQELIDDTLRIERTGTGAPARD